MRGEHLLRYSGQGCIWPLGSQSGAFILRLLLDSGFFLLDLQLGQPLVFGKGEGIDIFLFHRTAHSFIDFYLILCSLPEEYSDHMPSIGVVVQNTKACSLEKYSCHISLYPQKRGTKSYTTYGLTLPQNTKSRPCIS